MGADYNDRTEKGAGINTSGKTPGTIKKGEEGSLLSEKITFAENYFASVVIGGEKLFRRIITAYAAGGHILLEGVPGLAKTRAAKAVAEIAGTDFSRIQFTPDLLPSDITGNMVFLPQKGEFITRKGPVFAGVVLADEINRAPAKVQAALLEAMEERQVTIGDSTLSLPENFFVIATQNPIEQEGTYRLPEAQLDRFLMKLNLGYPAPDEEFSIISMHEKREREFPRFGKNLTLEDLRLLEEVSESIVVKDEIKKYIITIVRETRKKNIYIEYGASPRGSVGLFRCARINAFLENRKWVIPEDIKELAPDILRHRIITSFQAEAEGITADDVISSILDSVKIP